MFKQLASLANWKVMLPLTAIYLLFAAYLFPKYAAEMQTIAGKEVAILDIQTSYDLDAVNTLFTDLKAEGRALYHFVTSKVDMIYPLVYGCWMVLLLVMTWKGLLNR
ncbi:MAG: hypothetical protein AB8G22_20590, partial [Saprospiraceae bacterium]